MSVDDGDVPVRHIELSQGYRVCATELPSRGRAGCMKLDKESLIDVGLSVLGGLRPSDRFIDRALALAGGVIGGVATGAFMASRFFRTRTSRPEMVSRWLKQTHEGARASSTPSGLSQHHGAQEEEAKK